MNDKLIAKAIECYTEKLEEENKTLKDFMGQIDVAWVLRCYNEVFKEENEND